MEIKKFNVTAQVYETKDPGKQTILMNEIIESSSKNVAIVKFYDLVDTKYSVVKVYSVEELI